MSISNLENNNTKETQNLGQFLLYNSIFFIGIGGIGMSAIARFFKSQGKNVAGYDKTATLVTSQLENLGIVVGYEDEISSIPASFLDSQKTLVVYTPAVPSNHKQLNYFKAQRFTVEKRAEVLGKITKNTFSLAVAGTHGKTTTSAILGHIMATEKATAFLGGIAENYDANLILGDSKVTVMEADEFDRSFLHLSPNIACITSMDADHLDIYGDSASLTTSFKDFSNKVSDTLIVAKGLPLKGLTYAIEEPADYKAHNIRIVNGVYIFDIKTPNNQLIDVVFKLPGTHNVMNALAAVAMADIYGVSLAVIKQQLMSFKGVKRRFSYKIKHENLVLIDDYAHHPTEINAVYNSVREMYPNQRVLVVFQPHLFSRTKDFVEDFAQSLSSFDEVLLLDIYPARELPIPGITSNWLLEKVTVNNKNKTNKDSLVSDIKKSKAKIVVMLGAGDIGVLVDEVTNELLKEIK
ncbi:UDP-N-acetylmuramate--L-alanine ligase [Polaribacter tangerinus]|uniref:UDP-N-acetylmuramate--L-alanine ligase n=1 Tax=Polaribacter tangerinus TaxID=1920034 RepID=UPI000B4AD753|nr:UDP-N-acetylmuramate--L-alanine ligase [Polaribacter tangerinus]